MARRAQTGDDFVQVRCENHYRDALFIYKLPDIVYMVSTYLYYRARGMLKIFAWGSRTAKTAQISMFLLFGFSPALQPLLSFSSLGIRGTMKYNKSSYYDCH
jgi:hypothetical protein